jgi:hypothetical protein
MEELFVKAVGILALTSGILIAGKIIICSRGVLFSPRPLKERKVGSIKVISNLIFSITVATLGYLVLANPLIFSKLLDRIRDSLK